MTQKSIPLVLHVIHHLVMGGMENGLINLINTMPAGRYRHAIVCIEDYNAFRRRLARTDVEVIPLYRSRTGVWRVRREIYRICRRLRPTVVHSRNLSGLDALLPARAAGVPHCVHGEHGWDVDNLDGLKWKPALLRRLHSPLIDRFVAVSKDLQRFLVTQVGISGSRISQIYNGVDTDRFFPGRLREAQWLPPSFRGEAPIIIGTVGRLQPVKDQETLLRAFALLLDAHRDLRDRIRLAVIGDGPLMPQLRVLSTSLGIGAEVWFAGALDNLPEVLRALDLFVLSSLREGISNTVLEAMASGLPVVATAVGGNPELVEDRRSGVFFQPRDVTSLAGLLADYARQPALRRAQGSEARRIAVERFSLSAMVAQYQTVYDELCFPRALAV